MSMIRTVFVSVVLGASLTWLGGCTAKIVVTPINLEKTSVEVHIVGLTESEYHRWAAKSMTDYWKPDDQLRTDAVKCGIVYVMKFVDNKPAYLELKKDDPIWKTWSDLKVEYIFVLADLPGVADKPGDADPRRIILPAESSHWDMRYWGNQLVDIKVSPGGLKCVSKYTRKRPPDPS